MIINLQTFLLAVVIILTIVIAGLYGEEPPQPKNTSISHPPCAQVVEDPTDGACRAYERSFTR